MHTTGAPTRVGFQNYMLGDPYHTWCSCVNAETETDHRLSQKHRSTPTDLEKSHTVTTLLVTYLSMVGEGWLSAVSMKASRHLLAASK